MMFSKGLWIKFESIIRELIKVNHASNFVSSVSYKQVIPSDTINVQTLNPNYSDYPKVNSN